MSVFFTEFLNESLTLRVFLLNRFVARRGIQKFCRELYEAELSADIVSRISVLETVAKLFRVLARGNASWRVGEGRGGGGL